MRQPLDGVIMIKNLHFLRAFAAVIVVFYHMQAMLNAQFGGALHTYFGVAGVDVFFMISGFVMLHTNYSLKRNPIEFWIDRLIRILPLYWMALAALLLIFVAGMHPAGLHSFTASDLITSVLLIPHERSTGGSEPLLAVAWTLIYELYFYFIFGALLLLKSIRMIVISLSVIFLGSTALYFTPLANNFYFSVYTNPILLEFLAGVLLAVAYNKLNIPENFKIWGKISGAAAAVFGLGLILLYDFYNGSQIKGHFHQMTVFFIPALFVVGGALLAEKSGLHISSKALMLLGSASYATYLFHMITMQAIIKIAGKLISIKGPWLEPSVVVITLIITLAIGNLIHLHLEKPLMQLLKKRPIIQATQTKPHMPYVRTSWLNR